MALLYNGFDSSLFFDFAEALNIGLIVLDEKGFYAYVNSAYCKQVRRPKNFFTNVNINSFKTKGYIKETVWEKVMDRKRPVSSVITINDTIKRRVFDTLTTGVPFFSKHSEIKYVFILQEPIEHLNERLHEGKISESISFMSDVGSTGAPDVEIVAESPQMRELLLRLNRVAKTSASVLICGESGTGKDVLAEYIHKNSLRHKAPMVALNCASMPESIIESELFGYEKGAFSGASESGKPGLIEAARGGTLFLDEISSMPHPVQAKLLRVLETHKLKRLGAIDYKDVDFRLICASNENLHELVVQKKFRLDLYFRINVVTVTIPPLRERREDIIPLCRHFIKYYQKKYSCNKVFSAELLSRLLSMQWPGNVRELKNLIERIIITSPSEELEVNKIEPWLMDFPMDFGPGESMHTAEENAASDKFFAFSEDIFTCAPQKTYKAQMERWEKTFFKNALDLYHTPASVAENLELNLSSVYRKLKKHGLN